MIKNWKIRIASSIVLFAILVYFTVVRPEVDDVFGLVLWFSFCLGISGILLVAPEADRLPERQAKYFTRISNSGPRVTIQSSSKFNAILMGPILPVLLSAAMAGIFDHGYWPDRPSAELHYYFIGYLALGLLIFCLLILPVGYVCSVRPGEVIWYWKYFGKVVARREYRAVIIEEYASTNGSGGGPVVTISYADPANKRCTKKLRFRNLFGCTRDECCEMLSGYLGQPKQRTFAPTRGLITR